MPFIVHPKVSSQHSKVEGGKCILVADTTAVLDCTDPQFSPYARAKLERQQERVARRYDYDEVRLNPV